jgi:hypothetical protein
MQVPGMTLDEEMDLLQGDLEHLTSIQNRVGSEVNDHGFPMNDLLSDQIGRLERVWGQLYDKVNNTRT